ncbi:hypothetical protein K3495_g1195 [Podosphaera aphanis]|nr:hypothetical protein K3495_g1195 [Podosphaera aphanis]
MISLRRLLIFGGPFVILSTIAISIYVLINIRTLSLPIPQTFAFFTVFLPVIEAISVKVLLNLFKYGSKNRLTSLTLPVIALIVAMTIYETILGTLAISHTVPSPSLNCELGARWQMLFASKNEPAIRAIQDRFNCCGLNSVKDRAWPFTMGRSACAETFGRTQSCLRPWRKAEQTNSILILFIVLVVFCVKAAFVTSIITSTPLKPKYNALNEEEDEAEVQGHLPRLLEQSSARVEPGERPTTSSRLINDGEILAESNNEGSNSIEFRNEWQSEPELL